MFLGEITKKNMMRIDGFSTIAVDLSTFRFVLSVLFEISNSENKRK
jgi:hypothetical protein